ncbi:MAG TPA: bifunctional phosphoribosylaminoimidazolecarboxamide formyltransferase/IMP cyclohydrolase [bacterium]|nr:bifunctional phosphoribosylaminoimidazolecarboxamide formyltransferase/IMP cyclohydrolase [bacterium]
MKVQRALISVADKTGAVDLASALAALGVEIVSTGGTAAALRDAGVAVTPLSEVTGFPEILGGRVKTLHPAVHGGLLAIRGDAAHDAELARHGIRPIDLVAVTLYPFEAALARGADAAAMIEEIDIGGVTLLRAAAKNFDGVVVLSDPAQYAPVIEELRATGTVAADTRRRLARNAFARTCGYDAAIAGYLGGEPFPERLVLAFDKIQDLRYGENPHQRGAFYGAPADPAPSVATARQLGGKALSYNNIFDLDAALELVREFADSAAVVVKHGIPCGVGTGDTLRQAYLNAREGDPVSAFGGIVALNRTVDRATAEALVETFLEAVIAPAYDETARGVLSRKKNLRVMEVGPLGTLGVAPGFDLRRVRGGLLVQDRDVLDLDEARLTVVTSRAPTAREWVDLRFAWTVCRYVRSNAIVLARDRQVVGVGAGQMNRVEPVRLAVRQAGERAAGSVMASEAFFPFPDAVEVAIAAGVTAVIHPGGATRDAEVAAAAEAAGVAMVTTGIRHFRH